MRKHLFIFNQYNCKTHHWFNLISFWVSNAAWYKLKGCKFVLKSLKASCCCEQLDKLAGRRRPKGAERIQTFNREPCAVCSSVSSCWWPLPTHTLTHTHSRAQPCPLGLRDSLTQCLPDIQPRPCKGKSARQLALISCRVSHHADGQLNAVRW